MSDDIINEDLEHLNNDDEQNQSDDEQMESGAGERTQDGSMRNIQHLTGMYEQWFLDYASYVILERAVPYVNDGLKPVQRRILHSMREMDDGRYNKVANIIGNTMKYHPHGDASIGDALVQLGQKDLLVDCQGNWGNILTGDSAAAARYIEARLSKFALDVVFNPKTTNWQLSYDGRNREPITLPVKFPLLLAQGVEGIAVGLACKILPHNFNELLDACVAYLQEKPFTLYPDFPTGGMVDVSKYADGLRGGAVKVRAKIEKDTNNRVLRITEIPFGKVTSLLKESIIKACEKGKIKIKRIDDMTAASAEIVITLAQGVSSDKTIDALYACTDCEYSISPNACVIEDEKPHFVTISEILKRSVNDTVALLKLEQEIRMRELEDDWHYRSLERIFIEERIYKDKQFEESETVEKVIKHVSSRLEPFLPMLHRPIIDDDIRQLLEIKMKRILKFSSEEADIYIKGLEDEMKMVQHNIDHIIPFTIEYYKNIKKKYGKGRERRTEIRNFENIEATKVVLANEKLYINREEGFIGTALKKDEYICDCSDIDDVIVFKKDGTYYVTKVTDKLFIGKDVLHVDIFKKNDTRTIYNAIYKDGKHGCYYVKRFSVTGTTRDRQYDLTKGTEESKVIYFTANPNGEAEIIKVCLKPKPGMKKLIFEYNFANLAIKGRASMGNLLSKNDIHKIQLLQKGGSTLGGCKIWLDEDVLRLNTDNRGKYLGEFGSEGRILEINKNATYRTTDFSLENHYSEEYLIIEKFNPHKVWTVIYFDNEQGFYYMKRFRFEQIDKLISFIGEKTRLVLVSSEERPRFTIHYGGKYAVRPSEIVVADEFIGEKSYKAKGKRLTTYDVKSIEEIEPIPVEKSEDDEPIPDNETVENENFDNNDEDNEFKEPEQTTLF